MDEDTNNVESSNIHLKWLDKISDKFANVEKMQVLSREGILTLMEYLQMPPQARLTELPLAKYQNLRYFVTEMEMLVDCLAPIMLKHCPEDYKRIKENIELVFKDVNHKEFFLKEIKKGKVVVALETTDFFDIVLLQMCRMKSELIELNKNVLYLEDTRPF